MAQDTNLNLTPYFDDYDPEKNFHRVLFRPSFPIQARELTQLQTILQSQVERFGQNIYNAGTVISGCGVVPEPRYSYIKFNDIDAENYDVNIASFLNCIAVDQTTGLKAYITNVVDGLETSANGDLKTAYVKYMNAGSDQAQYSFANGATLLIQKDTFPIEDVIINAAGNGYSNSMYVNIVQSGNAAIVNAYARLVTNSNGGITDVTILNPGEGFNQAPGTISGTVVYANGGAVPLAVANNASLYFVNYVSQPIVNSTGFGYGLRVADGVIFQKGFFVRSDAQEIIVSKYASVENGQPNNVVVGFTTTESIVNSAADASLLDNASGFTNYQAPGADRLKLTPVLALKTLEELEAITSNTPAVENFFTLVEFQNGKIVRDKTGTQFNSVNTELARRTYEESGDYVVNQISLDTEEAEEIYSNTSFANTINVIVGKGVAYVQGYRNELKSAYRVNIPKANTIVSRNNQYVPTSYEQSITLPYEGWLGTTDIQAGEEINLYDRTLFDNYQYYALRYLPGITQIYPGSAIPADLSVRSVCGSPVGTARVRRVEFNNGSGTLFPAITVYLFDIKFNAGAPTTFYALGKNSKFIAGYYGSPLIVTGVENENIVFNAGVSAVSSISDEYFDYTKHWANTSVNSNGTFVLATSSAGVRFPQSGSLSLNDKQNFIIISKNNLVSSNVSGTFRVNANGSITRLTGSYSRDEVSRSEIIKYPVKVTNSANSAQSFFTQISYSADSNTFVTDISELGYLYGDIPVNAQYASATIAYAFPNNALINPGLVDITVTANNNTANVAFKYGTWTSASGNVDVLATVSAQNTEFTHTLFASNTFYVKIDSSVVNADTDGPWCLGVPNVYKIDGVWVGTGNTFADENIAVNQKGNFVLDTGQKDSLFGLSYLRIRPGATASLTGKNLLVKASCFTVYSNGAYISAESYAGAANVEYIPVFTTRQGEVISLRDAIDFRPIVSNTVTLAQSAAVANVINAAAYSTFSTENLTIADKKFPSPRGNFVADIDHYVPRRDRVVMDKNGNINVVTGIPSLTPELPSVSNNVMILGELYIPPYPSLSYYRALEVDRLDYAIDTSFKQQQRFTMQDIQEIQGRVETLEYYTSLSLLETKTQGLSITSEANQNIERFKYGFLVDPMNDTSISNSQFVNTTFEIDPVEQVATPRYNRISLEMKQFGTQTDTTSTVVLPNEGLPGRIATLAQSGSLETSSSFTKPTKQRNLVEGFIKYSGNIIVVPPIDTTTTQQQEGGRVPGRAGDVRFNQYIRAQRVYLRCTGLMPNRRHYVFFDGDPVSQRCRYANFSSTGTGTGIGNTNVQLITTASGSINIELSIPGNTYIIGEREIIVMDVDNLNSENASVSIARENFSGYGATVIVPAPPVHSDPLAQTFRVPSVLTVGGRYIKEVKVLFARKSTALPGAGVLLQIRKTVNGYPTGIEGTIARSQLAVANVNVLPTTSTSVNPNLYTTFTFNNPVFVESGVDYALVIAPEGNAPDYLAWVGKIGQTVVGTNQQYTTQDGTPGLIFQSTNDLAWSPVQDEDLVYEVKTVRFTSNQGVVRMAPRDYEFLTYGIKQNKTFDFEVENKTAQLSGVYCDGQISVNSTSALVTGHIPSAGVEFQDPTPVGNTYYTLKAVTSSISLESFNLGTNTGITNQGVAILRVEPTMATQLDASNRFDVAGSSTSVTAFNPATANIATLVSAGDFVVISTANNGNVFSTQTASNSSVIRQVVSITSNTEFVIDAPISANALSNVCVWVANNVKSFITTVYQANSSQIVLSDHIPYEFAANSTGSTGTQNVAISVVKVPIGTVAENNTLKNQLQLKYSTGNPDTGIKFRASNSTFLGTLISTTYASAVSFFTHIANTVSVDNIPIDTVSGRFNTLVPYGTSINFNFITAYDSTNILGTPDEKRVQFVNSSIIPINYDAVLRSKSNQATANDVSIVVEAELETDDLTCSPKIQIRPSSLELGSAIINSNTANEISANNNGAALAKYISKPAVLKEDANAEDLFVYVTAHRPANTDIKAYIKVLARTDSRTLNDVDWTELVMDSGTTFFSNATNPKDFKEYRFVLRTKPEVIATNGEATYTLTKTYSNTVGATFNSNTGVNSTNDFITLSSQPFSVNNEVQYIVATGNVAITGLSNASYYYVVFANSTGVKLSTSLGGIAADITATSTSETGHTLQGVAANTVANVVGTNTTWTTDLAANDVVVIVNAENTAEYDVGVVSSVTNNTLITLKVPLVYENGDAVVVEKMANNKQAFKYQKNEGVVRYYDGSLAAQDTFYQFAVKLVMTRTSNGVVPTIDDVRIIATSI